MKYDPAMKVTCKAASICVCAVCVVYLVHAYTLCIDVAIYPIPRSDCRTMRTVKLSPIPVETKTIRVSCPDGHPPVPRHIFVVNKDAVFSDPLLNLARVNPAYTFRGFSDAGARAFVAEHCGDRAARAYDCFMPPAYKADLFRFCALWSLGGIYFDSDLIPAVGIEQLYNPCENVTAGADMYDGIQIKIISARPRDTGIECALNTILMHVTDRYYGSNPLEVSGPLMFTKCVGSPLSTRVSLLYTDNHAAAFPYYGLRNGNVPLVYETPSKKHFSGSKLDYDVAWKTGTVYTKSCSI